MTAAHLSPSVEAPTTRPRRGPAFIDAVSVPLFGTLAWVAWVWLGAALLAVAVGAVLAAVGEPPGSSLVVGGMGILPWIAGLATGVTMLSTFAPMLVANGATRALVARTSTATLAVVSLLTALVVFVALLVEGAAYEALGWDHVATDGADIADIGAMAGQAASFATLMGCYAAAGWLIGAAWQFTGDVRVIVLIIPSLLPIVAAEVLVGGAVQQLEVNLLLGSLACLAIAAGAGLVASRATREIVIPA
jgi:hypothetical protein